MIIGVVFLVKTLITFIPTNYHFHPGVQMGDVGSSGGGGEGKTEALVRASSDFPF